MDALELVGVAGIIVPCAFTVFLALDKRARTSEKETAERRMGHAETAIVETRVSLDAGLADARAKLDALTTRLHDNDLVTERLKGRLDLQQAIASRSVTDLDQIRAQMVTKEMFESFSKRVEDSMRKYSSAPRPYNSPPAGTPRPAT